MEENMKKARTFLSSLLCALMLLSLFACDNGEQTTAQGETPTENPTETPTNTPEDETDPIEIFTEETVSNTETDSDETTEYEETSKETNNMIELGSYSNGGSLKDAGDSLNKSDFALTENVIDASQAITKSAEEMLALLSKKDGVKAGEVYRVPDRLIPESDTTYYGNGAMLILGDGVEIAGRSGVVLRELIIDGFIVIDHATDIELYKLEVRDSAENAVVIHPDCTDISIKDCILSAPDAALITRGVNVSVYKSKLVSDVGIDSDGDGLAIQECIIEARSAGISAKGKNAIVRNNTISADNGGVGVEMTDGYNGLVALNYIKDVQRSVVMSGGYNCVAVLNRAIYIDAQNNTHLYIVKNRLGGAMYLENNEYLICDGNTFVQDKKDHPVISLNNTEINGDNVTDVDARLEFGANEELLPHTNKEQFVGMERQENVRDLATTRSFNEYVRFAAQRNGVVIVPPGAYALSVKLMLGSQHSDTEIYAYGVYAEADFLQTVVELGSCTDVRILGLTVGYDFPVSAQIQIVEKNGNNKVTAIVSAGFDDGFGKSDPSKYHRDLNDMYHQDDNHPYMNIGGAYSIEKNADGTYTITFNNAAQYAMAEVGDIYTNRLATRGNNTILVDSSENVKFKDFTVYAYSAAASVRFRYTRGGSLERYHTDSPAPYIIDKETYDKYKALGEKYSVDTEVFVDEAGRYRGTRPRIGGTGALEVADSYQGISLTSCKIESICDDGSNQRGTTSRVAGIKDNCDGTYTVFFKGSHSVVYHTERCAAGATNSTWPVNKCADVTKGDVLLAYASNGAILFENAVALEDAKPYTGDTTGHWAHNDADGNRYCDTCKVYIGTKGLSYPELNSKYDPATGMITFNMSHNNNKNMLTFNTTLYAVRIKADKVNLAAADGYDLVSNDYHTSTQVFFHNVSKNCADFTFDNTLIQNHRSRGLLIKAPNITVKNCTFRDLQRHALVLGCENAWGESSVPSNINIQNCIFDNVCDYPDNYDVVDNVAINIHGLGEISNSITLNDNFACHSINITHNKFINNKGKHLIYASGARDINITENIFEEREGDGKIIYINGCIDVTISGNTYSDSIKQAIEKGLFGKYITAYKFKGLTVEGASIPDSDRDPQ